MNIAIIGAGFTGLTAAYHLSKEHTVTIFEKDSQPGGLALGIQEKNWQWSLEKHYHHWFTNDSHILTLAKDIGHEVLIKRPHTNWYVNGHIYEFDSITAALRFPALSPIDRLRNLATLGFFRFNPFWQPLERFNAHTVLPKFMGQKTYELLWEPLFTNKFGAYATDISLAWFWARIKKRTQSLAYPKGGFLQFSYALTQALQKRGVTIVYETEVQQIYDNKRVTLMIKGKSGRSHKQSFDRVIVTIPSPFFLKISPQLPKSYQARLGKLKGIGATNLLLRLNQPFLKNNTYWLSIADATSPIMAIVEHTNFMDKKYYDNEHLVYLGNYLPPSDPLFAKTKEELLSLYHPYLEKIHPGYRKSLIGYELFKAPFAQPIIPRNYSFMIPSFTTPFPHTYLATIEQVYPWDRGTNYAVELGEKVAQLIM